MIKAKITKIDGDIVSLRTEYEDDLKVDRSDIDFGILEGDGLFLKTESGKYQFRRLEKQDALEGDSHYYDSNWKKREDEYQSSLGENGDKSNYKREQEKEKNTIMNMALWLVVAIMIVLLIVAFKDKVGVLVIAS